MDIVEKLLSTSHQDNDQLQQLKLVAQNLDSVHPLEYRLNTKHQKQAEIVCSFVNDNGYGDAMIEANGVLFDIVVEIKTPLIDNVVCSLSSNLVFVADFFSVEFVGWRIGDLDG